MEFFDSMIGLVYDSTDLVLTLIRLFVFVLSLDFVLGIANILKSSIKSLF